MIPDNLQTLDLNAKFEQAMSYESYNKLMEQLVAGGKTSGPEQREDFIEYTSLNLRRVKRYEKTIKPDEEFVKSIKPIDKPQTWLVLSESWCGDAAPLLALVGKVAALNPNIRLGILLRDEHLDLMDLYLTNGGRSIPKLIIFDENMEEIGNWGPRPEPLAELRKQWMDDPEIDYMRVKELLQIWYAKDKGKTNMEELISLLK